MEFALPEISRFYQFCHFLIQPPKFSMGLSFHFFTVIFNKSSIPCIFNESPFTNFRGTFSRCQSILMDQKRTLSIVFDLRTIHLGFLLNLNSSHWAHINLNKYISSIFVWWFIYQAGLFLISQIKENSSR